MNWNVRHPVDPSISSIITRLFALKDFLAIFEHPPQQFMDYCIGISGLLWWLTLAQTLLQGKNYARTPSDHLSVAVNCILLGMDSRARTELDAADVNDKQSCQVKAHAYVALGDYDRAQTYARRFLLQAEGVPTPPSPNYIFFSLYGAIPFLRSTPEAVCGFIEYGDRHGLSDVLLADFAGTGTLSAGITPFPIAQFIMERGLVDRYPLAYMTYMFAADQEREVFDCFDASEPKELDGRRAIWLCLKALLWPARRTSDEEVKAFVEHWVQCDLAEIQRIAVTGDDNITKNAILEMVSFTQNYWAHFDIELAGVPSAVAAIDLSMSDDEILRNVRAARAHIMDPRPAATAPRASALVAAPASAT